MADEDRQMPADLWDRMADYRRAKERRGEAMARVNGCIAALRKAEGRLARAEAFLKARESHLHKAVLAATLMARQENDTP